MQVALTPHVINNLDTNPRAHRGHAVTQEKHALTCRTGCSLGTVLPEMSLEFNFPVKEEEVRKWGEIRQCLPQPLQLPVTSISHDAHQAKKLGVQRNGQGGLQGRGEAVGDSRHRAVSWWPTCPLPPASALG